MTLLEFLLKYLLDNHDNTRDAAEKRLWSSIDDALSGMIQKPVIARVYIVVLVRIAFRLFELKNGQQYINDVARDLAPLAVAPKQTGIKLTAPPRGPARVLHPEATSNWGLTHWQAGKDILRYLRQSHDTCLVYHPERTESPIEIYVDAAYAKDKDDRHSHTKVQSFGPEYYIHPGNAILRHYHKYYEITTESLPQYMDALSHLRGLTQPHKQYTCIKPFDVDIFDRFVTTAGAVFSNPECFAGYVLWT